jgi:hypothetical protein
VGRYFARSSENPGHRPAGGQLFTKVISLNGISIKAPSVVADQTLYAAYDRIRRKTAHLPIVVSNLAAAGAEAHYRPQTKSRPTSPNGAWTNTSRSMNTTDSRAMNAPAVWAD